MGGRRRLSVDINKCAICKKPLQDHHTNGQSSQVPVFYLFEDC